MLKPVAEIASLDFGWGDEERFLARGCEPRRASRRRLSIDASHSSFASLQHRSPCGSQLPGETHMCCRSPQVIESQVTQNYFPLLLKTCASTPGLCPCQWYPIDLSRHVPSLLISVPPLHHIRPLWRPPHHSRPTSRDFVPWRC